MNLRAVLAAGAVSLLFVSCNDDPLDMRSIVAGPRVLAIVADPPEVAPGQFVGVHAVLGGVPRGVTPRYRWFVCARPEATTNFVASSTFGQSEPDEGCFGDGAVATIDLGARDEAIFAVPSNLLEQIEALRAVYGSSLSAASLRRIADTVGLPFTVSLELTVGSTTIRALKRVIVTTRTQTNTNPPPVRFRFAVDRAPDAGIPSLDAALLPDGGVPIATGGIPFRADPGDPERCLPEGVPSVSVERGAEVEIAPDEQEDSWLESYPTLTASGAVGTMREQAFYSWFATAGEFSLERTRRPIRDTVWTAPRTTGPVTQWLVVRDGRGGTSACRFELRVIEPATGR